MFRGHHAYLIVGAADSIIDDLRKQLAPAEIIWEARPQFGIEESRFLREYQARKVGQGEERCFILQFLSITVEAQQALLKTLEEPAERTRFFLVAPSVQPFLPTLLSRLQVVSHPSVQELGSEEREGAKGFWSADPEERLTQVNKLLGDEAAPAVSRSRLGRFVSALESVLHDEFKELSFTKTTKAYAYLAQARGYLEDRAASPRLILEHLALVLPRL